MSAKHIFDVNAAPLPNIRGPIDMQSSVLTREKFERFMRMAFEPEPEEKRIARERYIATIHATIAARIERELAEESK